MLRFIRSGVIFSTILAFSSAPQSIALTPGIFSAKTITSCFASWSSPEIRQSQSISFSMLVRLAALILLKADTTLTFLSLRKLAVLSAAEPSQTFHVFSLDFHLGSFP